MSNEFDNWCIEQGIDQQHTVKRTPQQNGVSKHLNHTFAERIIVMLNQAGLLISFWGMAVLYLACVLNTTPSSTLSKTMFYKVWYERKPDISMYRAFGCQAWVLIPRKKQGNLDSHTQSCIFLGFKDGYKGWKCYNPVTKKVIISQDVIFQEDKFPGLSTNAYRQAITPIGIHEIWPEKDAPAYAADPDPPAPPAPPGTQSHLHAPDLSDTSDSRSSNSDSDNNGYGDPSLRTPEQPPCIRDFLKPKRMKAPHATLQSEEPPSPTPKAEMHTPSPPKLSSPAAHPCACISSTSSCSIGNPSPTSLTSA
jgi:hypothetical protein